MFKNTISRVAKTYKMLIEDEYDSEEKIHSAIGSHNDLGKVGFYISSSNVKSLLHESFDEKVDIYAVLKFKGEEVTITNSDTFNFEIKTEPKEFDLQKFLTEINKHLDKFYPLVETLEISEETEDVQSTNSENLETLETYRDGYFYEKGKSEALQNTLNKMFYFKK